MLEVIATKAQLYINSHLFGLMMELSGVCSTRVDRLILLCWTEAKRSVCSSLNLVTGYISWILLGTRETLQATSPCCCETKSWIKCFLLICVRGSKQKLPHHKHREDNGLLPGNKLGEGHGTDNCGSRVTLGKMGEKCFIFQGHSLFQKYLDHQRWQVVGCLLGFDLWLGHTKDLPAWHFVFRVRLGGCGFDYPMVAGHSVSQVLMAQMVGRVSESIFFGT